MPAGHPGAGGAAGRLVVGVDTEACLHHDVAVVELVLAVFVCRGENREASEPKGRLHQREEKGRWTWLFILDCHGRCGRVLRASLAFFKCYNDCRRGSSGRAPA